MSDKESKTEEKKPIVIKNATDLQRLKLEKLMKNPDKPVVIPDPPKQKSLAAPPDFVRNVMGSSAGAGSGEFHVYRHLRRKEYARQKFIQEKSEKEKLDDEYHRKIEENRRASEERTAKKRAKRLKKKKNAKLKGKKPKIDQKSNTSSQSDSSSEEDNKDKPNSDTEEITKVANESNMAKDSSVIETNECSKVKEMANSESIDTAKETNEFVNENVSLEQNTEILKGNNDQLPPIEVKKED